MYAAHTHTQERYKCNGEGRQKREEELHAPSPVTSSCKRGFPAAVCNPGVSGTPMRRSCSAPALESESNLATRSSRSVPLLTLRCTSRPSSSFRTCGRASRGNKAGGLHARAWAERVWKPAGSVCGSRTPSLQSDVIRAALLPSATHLVVMLRAPLVGGRAEALLAAITVHGHDSSARGCLTHLLPPAVVHLEAEGESSLLRRW